MKEITPLDYINVGKAGTFSDSGNIKTTPKQVDMIFDHLREQDVEKLLIYFHGGLVSEKNGMDSAKVMMNNFTNSDEKRHAVSFIWETGPKEVILQNLDHILDKTKKSFYQEALKFVIKLVGKRLRIKDSRGGGEYLSDATIEEEKLKQVPFEDLDKIIDARGGTAELSIKEVDERRLLTKIEMESKVLIQRQASEEFKSTTTEDDPSLPQELEPEVDGQPKGGWLGIVKVVAEIAFKVLKRYFNKTHHDFYPTIMEETFRKLYVGSVGTWGWSRIKDKAEAMFADNTGRTNEDLHAGSYFLELLQKHYLDRIKNDKKFSISLVGHSAGSIVICVLLKSLMEKYKALKFDTVFFLAPACRTDLFLSHCIPAKLAGNFNKFKMFTMREENEKKDHCIPYVYTHSLLYLVSGLFEVDADQKEEIDARIMGLNEQFMVSGRYAGVSESIELNKFLSGHSLILSDDNINEDLSLRSTALKHADFDNDEPTLISILKSL